MAESPSAQTGAYPIADDVMQLARALTNDMLRDKAGRILTNTAPFSIVYLNSSIKKVQRYFANNGLENFIKDNVILSSIAPVATQDPSVQVSISYTGYFDGVNMNAQPVLPSDFLLPLALWERPTGTGGSFVPMSPTHKDGLPSRVPGQNFDIFEYRNDKLYMIGANVLTDLRLRYEAMIPAIGTSQDLTKVSIPLIDAQEALAAWVIYFYGFARGSVMRLEAKKMAEEEMDEVVHRHVRKDERIAYRPAGYRAGGGPVDGALTGSYK
jgi:hypothetical protein